MTAGRVDQPDLGNSLRSLDARIRALEAVAPSGGGGGGGVLLDYVERPTTLVVSGDATAQDTVIAGNPVTYDGATRVCVEFYCVQPDLSGAGNLIVELWQDTTDLARWAQFTADPATDYSWGGLNMRRYLTPPAGTYAHTVKAWTTTPGSTPTLGAGAGTGGDADYMPMYLQIATAPS